MMLPNLVEFDCEHLVVFESERAHASLLSYVRMCATRVGDVFTCGSAMLMLARFEVSDSV